MSLEQEKRWITGAEFGEERRRLLEGNVPDDDPRFQELYRRVDERDDYLFERYGRPYIESHPGKWIAISLEGEVIIRDTAGELSWAAREKFGGGNFSKRKLADFPGHQITF